MKTDDTAFKSFRVSERQEGEKSFYRGDIVQRRVGELPAGDVLIRVRYSSLNYKDALSATGNKASL